LPLKGGPQANGAHRPAFGDFTGAGGDAPPRARRELRCLTVRVSDRTVRHLISTGYLSLERSDAAAAVAIALEAWIADNFT